jgi:hypothetical protein
MNKNELAAKFGLKVWDNALPQIWLDRVCEVIINNDNLIITDKAYRTILGGTVWCYDGSLFGYAYALTKEAYDLIKTYESIMGTKELCQEGFPDDLAKKI